MNNILALTDFSEISEYAVEIAFQYCKKHKATLTIFHQSDASELATFELDKNSEIEIDGKNPITSSDQFGKWKQMSDALDVTTRYLEGGEDFVSVVDSIARKTSADLIIMGSTGTSGGDKPAWGSNTQKIVKSSQHPVLIIKHELQDDRLDNIVFASSFDEKERHVLKTFLTLMNPPKDAMIHFLSIDTSAYFSQPTILMHQVQKDFQKLALPWKSLTHFYENYSIDAGITRFLEEVNPDMLVMSTKTGKPIKHFFQSNHALNLATKSDFPVLTIPYQK